MKFTSIHTLDPTHDTVIPVFKNNPDTDELRKITDVKFPEFEGKFGQDESSYTKEGVSFHLVGLGEEKHQFRFAEAFRKWTFATRKKWRETMQIDGHLLTADQIYQVVLGLCLAEYRIGFMKTAKDDQPIDTTVSIATDLDISVVIREAEYEADTINRAKKLVDTPSNEKTPQFLANWAIESAKKYGYQCRVIRGKELEKMGFGALLAVGGGSINTPCLIELSYMPKAAGTVDLGLVGKGITFDSGGISIKPSQNMHYMKSDMGGAAAVLGAMELVARLELAINVVGVVAAAENAVDANSFRPGDVINSYSGKTIEVIDTDAEGRLVLADGLSYIIDRHKPEQLIDLATLTGSVVRTLGYSAAGIFSTNDDLVKSLMTAGEKVHERVWPFPLFDDFDEDLHSDIADLKNLSDKPVAGAITAAKFLQAFTQDHPRWAHLDIAGMAFGSNEYAKMKSATGYGVRLIITYMKLLIATHE